MIGPDVIITSPTIRLAYERLLRRKTIKRVGSYEFLELDGHRWWQREFGIKGSDGIFPRTDGEYTTWYLPTKAMRKRGYKSQQDYWFKEPQ